MEALLEGFWKLVTQLTSRETDTRKVVEQAIEKEGSRRDALKYFADASFGRIYNLSLLIEIFICSGFRLFLALILFSLPIAGTVGILITGGSIVINILGWLFTTILIGICYYISFSPIVYSFMAFNGMRVRASQTREVLSAREPSRREEVKLLAVWSKITEAITEQDEDTAGLQTPSKAFDNTLVIDNPLPFSYTVGRDLFISSGAIRNQHLLAILAHELGHNQDDFGAFTLALRLLIWQPFQTLQKPVKTYSTASRGNFDEPVSPFQVLFSRLVSLFLALVGGGLSIRLFSSTYAEIFRQYDYLADDFVANTAQARTQLIDYLEEKQQLDSVVPYMLGWSPSYEERLDKILHAGERSL